MKVWCSYFLMIVCWINEKSQNTLHITQYFFFLVPHRGITLVFFFFRSWMKIHWEECIFQKKKFWFGRGRKNSWLRCLKQCQIFEFWYFDKISKLEKRLLIEPVYSSSEIWEGIIQFSHTRGCDKKCEKVFNLRGWNKNEKGENKILTIK